jgi:3-dehydroquinate dehydratase-2
MKILIVNGPNLNKLGKRNNEIYGSMTLNDIYDAIKKEFPDIQFEFFQSNIEGFIIEEIQQMENEVDALIINPGAFSHYSIAIRDALLDFKKIKIEVHLSNISAREEFRQKSITAAVCDGYISGFKEHSYLAAVYLVKKLLSKE